MGGEIRVAGSRGPGGVDIELSGMDHHPPIGRTGVTAFGVEVLDQTIAIPIPSSLNQEGQRTTHEPVLELSGAVNQTAARHLNSPNAGNQYLERTVVLARPQCTAHFARSRRQPFPRRQEQ